MEHKQECWYKEVCSEEPTKCNSCVRFLEMKTLIEESGIPMIRTQLSNLRVWPDEVDNGSYVILNAFRESMSEFVCEGKSLYIYSETTGNGKTTWAIKLMLKYFENIWYGNGLRCRGVFVHVPTLLATIKDFSKSNTGYLTKIKTADLVVWDDIASTNMSNYDYSQLLTLMDYRVLNIKADIYTGNLEDTELLQVMGSRLYSRIWNASSHVHLKGKDRRKPW